jgi:hypothetical protein
MMTMWMVEEHAGESQYVIVKRATRPPVINPNIMAMKKKKIKKQKQKTKNKKQKIQTWKTAFINELLTVIPLSHQYQPEMNLI